MIIQEKDYLKSKKIKFLTGTIIWFIVMITIMITGYILNKTRKNVFTVVAAILVLPVAQYATQLLSIWKFKDPDKETSELFESIQGNYNLFHSVLIPDKKEIINFDHIIVTGENIYCIMNKHPDIAYIKKIFNKKLLAKGIPIKTMTYIEIDQIKNKQKLLEKIEVAALKDNEKKLKEYTQLIAQMMM